MKKRKQDAVAKPTSRNVQFSPLSEEQAHAYKACAKNDITFITGPAGSTKTHTAVCFAVDYAINTESRLILTRPIIEACGESIGALPGNGAEKLEPYVKPARDVMGEYCQGAVVKLETIPLAFARGLNLHQSVVIVDEAQNATIKQLKMIITRIGKGSKIILCGDSEQVDIHNSGLMAVAERMSKIQNVGWVQMSIQATIARHPLMPQIIAAFKDIEKDSPRSSRPRRMERE